MENQKKIKNDIIVSQKIIKKEYNLKKIAQIYLSIYKRLQQRKREVGYKPVLNTEKKELKYFTSPIIANYGASVYLYEDKKLLKFNFNRHKQDIVTYCREAKTLSELKLKTKMELVRLKKVIKELVNNKIIIQN